MYQKLLSHNADLKKLVDKGYALDLTSQYLIVRSIPYLNDKGLLEYGTIITQLQYIAGTDTVKPHDHQIYFSEIPYGLDEKPIPNLFPRDVKSSINLGENYKNFVVKYQFSNKPPSSKYNDFFDKIETYVTIISGPATTKYPNSKYLTFDPPLSSGNTELESVFLLPDIFSTRAGITDLSHKLKDEVIAIIGLGGTGGYILDFLAKTQVKEIRLFDFDIFELHNSFRSPGKLDKDEFGKYKVDVYESRYRNFRKGIVKHEKFVNESSKDDLKGVTFAFVCIDKGVARADIIALLSSMNIPFIDTGIGISHRTTGGLRGHVRTSYFSTDKQQIETNKKQVPLIDNADDIYKTNVQIAELNALNACLAVMRYKQLKGFYETNEDLLNTNLLFNISDIHIFRDKVEN